MKKQKQQETIEIRPGVFEPLSDQLIDRCKGDIKTASFFHRLGSALKGEGVCDDASKSGKFVTSKQPEEC